MLSSALATAPLLLVNRLDFTAGQLGLFMSANSLAVAAFLAVGTIPAMARVGDRPDVQARCGIGCSSISAMLFGVVGSLVVVVEMLSARRRDDLRKR